MWRLGVSMIGFLVFGVLERERLLRCFSAFELSWYSFVGLLSKTGSLVLLRSFLGVWYRSCA